MTELLDQLRFGAFTLDLSRSELLHEDQRLPLRRQAFDTLRHLVERSGQVVAKKDLIAAVWSAPPADPEGSLAQCIKEIRRALGEEARWMIRTVPGSGYEFKAAVDMPQTEVRIGDAEELSRPVSRWLAIRRRPLLAGTVAILTAVVLITSTWVVWSAVSLLRYRDPEKESYRYRPIGTVPSGGQVTIQTEDGRTMSCVGGVIGRQPRRCWWE